MCVYGCPVVVGSASSCCEGVCVSVVVFGLAIIFAAGNMIKLDAVGVVIGALLMTSKSYKSCLLYFSGLTCRLMVLDLTTLLGKNLASIFGICFAVGNISRTVSPNPQIGVLCSLFQRLQ